MRGLKSLTLVPWLVHDIHVEEVELLVKKGLGKRPEFVRVESQDGRGAALVRYRCSRARGAGRLTLRW